MATGVASAGADAAGEAAVSTAAGSVSDLASADAELEAQTQAELAALTPHQRARAEAGVVRLERELYGIGAPPASDGVVATDGALAQPGLRARLVAAAVSAKRAAICVR